MSSAGAAVESEMFLGTPDIKAMQGHGCVFIQYESGISASVRRIIFIETGILDVFPPKKEGGHEENHLITPAAQGGVVEVQQVARAPVSRLNCSRDPGRRLVLFIFVCLPLRVEQQAVSDFY